MYVHMYMYMHIYSGPVSMHLTQAVLGAGGGGVRLSDEQRRRAPACTNLIILREHT